MFAKLIKQDIKILTKISLTYCKIAKIQDTSYKHTYPLNLCVDLPTENILSLK